MSEARVVKFMKYFVYAIVVLSIFAAGFGSAVLYLWNWLMPPVFGLHTITYWQALGLLCLCWVLFGGQRGWMGSGMHSRRRMRGRWEHMSPEQREQFRAAMRGRCGVGTPAPEQKA
ncbi:MAG TPA: hypothetical protein VFA85_17520 [Terriglobales bacterium]|nr:hypothetical protein [Terriglobales bacterium]